MEDIYVDIREIDGFEKIFKKDFVSVDEILYKLDEINYELNDLRNEYEEFKADVWENYTRRTPEVDD